MKKTIYHDAILSMGKYKGQAVADVLKADPGYFLWLIESGTYSVDDLIAHEVDTWAIMNATEAAKVRRSAQGAKKTREAEKGVIEVSPGKSFPEIATPDPVHIVPPPVERPMSWGAWS